MIKVAGTFLLIAQLLVNVCMAKEAMPPANLLQAGFTEDTIRVNNLILASKNHFNTDPKKAVTYGEQAHELATKINFKKGSAYALKNIGIAYYIQGNYVQTLNYWQQSLNIFKSIGDKLGEANILSNLGAVYANQGDNVKALNYHLKSLRVSEKLGNKLRIATSLINIGSVYLNKPATHDKARKYYLRALPISEEINDKDAIGTATVNLGDLYFEQGNDTLALVYFKKSLEAYKGSENVPASLNSMAKVYLKRKDYTRAIDYHNQALKIAENLNGQLDIAQSLLGLANTYSQQGKTSIAISYYEKAKTTALKINSLYDLEDAYRALALLYAKSKDYNKAYKYQNLLIGAKDSLYNIAKDKKVAELQFDFEIKKKQGEINLLVKNKELQTLELKRQRFVKNSLFGGLLLVFVIAFALFRNYRIKSKTNKLLDHQKAEIESLLSNILPSEVAKELQRDGQATPRYYESVSVLFSDFKNFTQMADVLSPQDVVHELNTCFIAFDDIIEKYNLEKIKTIGDAYMCAGGIPAVDESHPIKMVKAALEIKEYIKARNEAKKETGDLPWELRIGIHTGPVVAGVVGRKKYAYDIWGSTVNTASRMESNGEPGRVNISAATYQLVKDHYECTYRGKVLAKNVGEIDMYFVDSVVSHQPTMAEERKQNAFSNNPEV